MFVPFDGLGTSFLFCLARVMARDGENNSTVEGFCIETGDDQETVWGK